ncbi:MAG: SHOCT domain-containing protein [Pseudolysinimonas sp.]
MAKQAPAGYYPDSSGRKRWWDGSAWTDRYEDQATPSSAAPVSNGKPLYSFVSHIDGKNAKVEIYEDRIEWERKALSAFKVVTGVGFVTGFRNKNTDMVPIRQVSSITSKKGLGINTVVTVNTSGGALEFRTSHKEAASAKDLVQRLMLQASQPQQVVVQAAASAPAAESVTDQLQKLASLRDAGILTEEEFTAKKTELLARM